MATNAQHKGIQLVPRKTALYLKWKDPRTGKYREQRLPDGTTKREAKEAAIQKKHALDAMKRRVATGELREVESGTDILAQWIDEVPNPRTRRNRARAGRFLRELEKALGDRDWSEVTRQDLNTLKKIIGADDTLSPNTKNMHLGLCKAFFSHLRKLGHQAFVDQEIIKDSLSKFRSVQAKSGELLDRVQLQKVFLHLSRTRPDVGLFMLLKFLVGYRIGEGIEIQGKDFVLAEGRQPILKIRATKTHSVRDVSLAASPLAVLILKALKERHGDGKLFRPEDTRNTISRYKPYQVAVMKTMGRQLGMALSPKSLRSSCEAFLCHAESFRGNTFKIAANMGHGIQVAMKSYQRQANLLEIKAGKTLEEMAGLELIGMHLLKQNGFDTDALQAMIEETKFEGSLEGAETLIETLVHVSETGGIDREDHPELESYWQAMDKQYQQEHERWSSLSDEEKEAEGYVQTGPDAWTHVDELKRLKKSSD
jgi:integrase